MLVITWKFSENHRGALGGQTSGIDARAVAEAPGARDDRRVIDTRAGVIVAGVIEGGAPVEGGGAIAAVTGNTNVDVKGGAGDPDDGAEFGGIEEGGIVVGGAGVAVHDGAGTPDDGTDDATAVQAAAVVAEGDDGGVDSAVEDAIVVGGEDGSVDGVDSAEAAGTVEKVGAAPDDVAGDVMAAEMPRVGAVVEDGAACPLLTGVSDTSIVLLLDAPLSAVAVVRVDFRIGGAPRSFGFLGLGAGRGGCANNCPVSAHS
ncbi:hypothetical protein DFH09DRAFT_1087391 [Mycena vulgaris]|nr:hypothetical protein DFH09DRAFT_1087391 [Mycena vulgaris]